MAGGQPSGSLARPDAEMYTHEPGQLGRPADQRYSGRNHLYVRHHRRSEGRHAEPWEPPGQPRVGRRCRTARSGRPRPQSAAAIPRVRPDDGNVLPAACRLCSDVPAGADLTSAAGCARGGSDHPSGRHSGSPQDHDGADRNAAWRISGLASPRFAARHPDAAALALPGGAPAVQLLPTAGKGEAWVEGSPPTVRDGFCYALFEKSG